MSVNSIRNLIEKASLEVPLKTAIKDDNSSLTYKELLSKVNKIAKYLNTLNLNTGAKIGIYSSKNIHKVIAILSVMSTKYIFVPITKLLKAEQVKYIIDDCDIECIITDKKKF